MRVCVILFVTLTFPGTFALAEPRTWTDRSGEARVEAELLDFNRVKVWLKVTDGRVFAAAMKELSQADQQHVEKLAQARTAVVAADAPGAISYGPPKKLGELANKLVAESSGVACSRNRVGVFWTHNDSGGAAQVFAFDAKGKDLGSCVLEDIWAYDWEDMASVTLDGTNYLLLGDVGNNGRSAAVQMLYLVEEPPIDPLHGVLPEQIPIVQLIHFSYEDAHRDCEGLAVDPTDKTILLVSKERSRQSHVYRLPWPKNDPKKVSVARKIATLKIPPATALDVSPDGRRAIVLTYAHAYEYTRAAEEDWATAFSRRGRMLAMPQRTQGESICYGTDGKTLYLTSEKLPTPLWQVPVREAD